MPTFTISDIKLYVSVVTLSAQGYVKLFKQLELGVKRTTNGNRYQPKITNSKAKNWYFLFLSDLSFQGVNRPFVSSFKDRNVWERYKRYFLPTVEIKDYNVWLTQEISLINQ